MTPHLHTLTELSAYLLSRREALLNNWRSRCQEELPTATSLSREEFNDCIPLLLNILEQRLRNIPDEADPRQIASEHGLHRWHKGYTLMAILLETSHLLATISAEIETFCQLNPETPASVVRQAYPIVQSLISDIIRGSVERFDQLDRAAATERLAQLQRALDELNEFSRQRSDYLRTASHDLRGSLGVISGAASLLEHTGASDELQHQMAQMVLRNAADAHALITEVIDLSRLEARQEELEIDELDVGELLHQLVLNAQPLAARYGLPLQSDGPASLVVQGDRLKIQRIVQNLIQSALRHTATTRKKGSVSVTWASDTDSRWILSVQDSGTGLPPGVATWLSDVLKPFHDTTGVLYDIEEAPDTADPGPPPSESKGDSIGLFIVKRLCELMNASIDIEAVSAHNDQPASLIFRIRFPTRYDVPSAD